AFIAKAKEFEKAAGDRAQALKLAIEYCREHDILKEFLETHSTGGLMTLIKSVTFFGPTPFGLIHPPARRLAGVFWAGF
ncbi:MAG: hypothetical protein FWE09_04655, partial [Treponema sp.]|nr:hypothetical protein [Treponema sp.]